MKLAILALTVAVSTASAIAWVPQQVATQIQTHTHTGTEPESEAPGFPPGYHELDASVELPDEAEIRQVAKSCGRAYLDWTMHYDAKANRLFPVCDNTKPNK